MNLLVNDDDKEMIVIIPVIQKRQDRFDLLADDDDKENIKIVPSLQKTTR